MEKSNGLYYPDGSFSDRDTIRRKLLFEEITQGRTGLRHLTPEVKMRNFSDWTDIMIRRQNEVKELLEIPESISVEIDSKHPLLVWLVADLHGGGESDYKRFLEDLAAVKEVGGYSIPVGDMTDSFFWSAGMDAIVRGDEQTLFAQAAFKEMASGGKMIAAFGGDHDMWGKDKTGSHTLY